MELLIRNGQVIDGTGNPCVRVDVGIDRGKIVHIGRGGGVEAERTIDAGGLTVTPGFIDIHTHSDFTLLADPRAESSVRQGVTTEVVGNCGFSAAPLQEGSRAVEERALGLGLEKDWNTFGEYLGRLEKQGIAHNVLSLVGHSTVREPVMGYAARAATSSELEEMKRLVAQAMEEGAVGLSSGLEYLPGGNSDTHELVELCKVVGRYGGIYASHIRDMNDGVLDATRELIKIGEESGIPVHHSHLGSFFPAEGWMGEIIELMEDAREKGIEITSDACLLGIVSSYPPEQQRPAGLAGINTILPAWAFEGGTEELMKRLRDPETREKFKQYKKPKFRQILLGKWDTMYLHDCEANRDLINKTFAEIAKIRGVDPYDAALDLMLEEAEATGNVKVSMTGKTTTVDNVRAAVAWPLSSISSDARSVAPSGPTSKRSVHPHTYGNFPCFFRKFVKMEKLLRLEDAVRKCTSLPAQTLGLKDRGMLRESMWADIVVFDPETIEDKATYENRQQFPEGIEYVIVNGEVVVEGGQQGDVLPGKVIRRPW